MNSYYSLALVVLVSCAGEPKTPATSDTPASQEMKPAVEQMAPTPAALVARFTKYDIAVIRKGPKWTKDAPSRIKELSAQNQASWHALVEQGKLLGIARLVEPGDFWGLAFFKADSKEEMNAIVTNAPSVKEGLLSANIRTVWGSRGLGEGLVKAAQQKQQVESTDQTYYMVVMSKGPKWSDAADAPETREATGEAMTFMYGLYEEGYLRYYAAMEDVSLDARNISILNVSSAADALKLVTASPAVTKGWHVPAVYALTIPDGVIP